MQSSQQAIAFCTRGTCCTSEMLSNEFSRQDAFFGRDDAQTPQHLFVHTGYL
jgi:hypothetical protein